MDRKKKPHDEKDAEREEPEREKPAMITEVVPEDEPESPTPIIEDLMDNGLPEKAETGKQARQPAQPAQQDDPETGEDGHGRNSTDDENVRADHSGHERHERHGVPEDASMAEGDETTTVKSKEVVQELFSKPNGGGISEISIKRKGSGRTLFWWAVVVLVAAITTGLSLVFFSGAAPAPSFMPASPTPTRTPSPSPTPKPMPLRSDLKVQVLNGGGVAGAATKMKDFLVELEYQVTDVGNTEEYSFDVTEISVKAGNHAVAEMIKSDLTESYTVGNTDTTLIADSPFDAIVTVGKE